jgi:soluble lytic murein transglycosylase-like protein
MNNRLSSAVHGSTGQAASQSSAWTMIAHDTKNGFKTTMHHALMTAGIVAIGALGFIFIKPEMVDHVKALSPFSADPSQQSSDMTPQLANIMAAPEQAAAPAAASATASGAILASIKPQASGENSKIAGTTVEQERVIKWLSRRYRVAADATNMLVSAAYLTAQDIKLDPLLILSVMAIESRFNPFAESPVGAQGLMQVMSKVHHEKFQKLGGIQAALNPVANIKVGAQILKEYVRRGGSVEAGLKMYVGAAAMETDLGYGSKVLAEYKRLKDVAAGKKVPTYTAVASRAPAAKDTADRPAEEKPSTLTQAESTADETPV